jgi:hypothetical protein
VKIRTIEELCLADPDDPETILMKNALAETLGLTPSSGAVNAWRTYRKEEIRQFVEHTSHWKLIQVQHGSAVRLDGAKVHILLGKSLHAMPRSAATLTPRWAVTFSISGEDEQTHVLAGTSLADIMSQVDTRWPMPAWWLEMSAPKPPPVPLPKEELYALLDQTICFLDLPSRIRGCVESQNFWRLGDLVQVKEPHKFWAKQIRKPIEIVLEIHRLYFGMDVQGWTSERTSKKKSCSEGEAP